MQSSEFSDNLRKKQTPEEKGLWFLLKDRKLSGFKFRRQVQIDMYCVDFCCMPKKLIIELDGAPHKINKEYDVERTKYLLSQGFEVLRIWNGELTNKRKVLEKIRSALFAPSSVNLSGRS